MHAECDVLNCASRWTGTAGALNYFNNSAGHGVDGVGEHVEQPAASGEILA